MAGIENIINSARFGLENSMSERVNSRAKAELKQSQTVKPGTSNLEPRTFSEQVNKEISKSNSVPARKRPEDKALKDACVEMESIFVAKMLKEMRKTVHKSGWLNGGFAEEIFEDMLYDKYSLSVSKNSNLGLANMLYKEMSQRT
ncbi:MAG: cell division protein [bacterium]|nr:cell division protein [bacterium]